MDTPLGGSSTKLRPRQPGGRIEKPKGNGARIDFTPLGFGALADPSLIEEGIDSIDRRVRTEDLYWAVNDHHAPAEF
jgi:hypothetical protein